jgi:hypothetical protein
VINQKGGPALRLQEVNETVDYVGEMCNTSSPWPCTHLRKFHIEEIEQLKEDVMMLGNADWVAKRKENQNLQLY